MTTLISFLGKNTGDAKTGYRTANYRFAPDFARQVPYFGMALVEYARPDKLILAGTAGSMWDVFFSHQEAGDEVTIELMAAVEEEAVKPALLARYEKRLTEQLGIPVQCLLISYARDEAEQAAILTGLAAALQPGEEVIVDVTHGFRHLPMLALVAARYLTHVRHVRVHELYYGALQMTDRATGETPVLRLGTLLRMLDWTEALAAYDTSGNYGVFAGLFQADGMQPDHAAQLERAAYFERSNNPAQARQALTSVHASLQAHHGPLGQLFRSTLGEQINWFRKDSRADWELALADRYLQRKDYLRATSFLYEGLISRAVWNDRGDVNSFGDRDRAKTELEKNNDIWLLFYLRNAMAHGVRAADNRHNRTAQKAQRLLGDPAALDQQLRALRKKLFA